ncbi:MAG TPA: DUF456 domain-containing protein [Halococcus sp.]|nr:DUF456 domain-containing protein [Halococcus sp.]
MERVVSLLTIVAVALLVLGVLGSVVPLLPGPLLSLAGVYCYWWQSGYAEPGLVLLAVLTFIGLLAIATNYLAGAVSARAGGASSATAILAAVVGIVLFFITGTGPLGLVVGVVVTVFVVEFARHRDPERSAKTAVYTAIGMFASMVFQFLLTLSMLVALLAVIVL